jgi:hypothetical protein
MMRIPLGLLFLGCALDSAAGQTTLSDASYKSTNSEIEQRLDQKRDMMFNDATLVDVRTFFQMNGIPTYLDQRALDDVGIGIDMPLTFRYQSIRLRDGLHLLLKELDLTWTIRHGCLIITTPEEAESRLITKIYDVRNLVEPVPVPYLPDFESLVDAIRSSVAPTSWDFVGGPGSIEPYCTRRMRVIVVSQTYHIHRQVDSLLRELAEHGGTTPLPDIPAHLPPQRPRTLATPRYVEPAGSSHKIRSSQLRTTGQ